MADTTQARPASFVAVFFGFLIVMTGTTIPTPLYAIYQSKFDFSALMITILFAVYALTVVATLLLFGRASDDVGRKPVLVTAALFGIASSVCFLLADNVAALMAGRILSGVSAGLVTGTGTAALLDLGGDKNRARSAVLAVAANAGGLGLGTTGAGLLADHFGSPLYLSFWVHLMLAAVALVALLTYKSPDKKSGRLTIQFQKPKVPKEVRPVFARAAIAAGSGFAVTGVLTAVVSLFLKSALDNDSHALAGGIVGAALVNVAIGQLIVRRMHEHKALTVGCAGLIVGAGLIATALLTEHLTPLALGAVVVGLSTGLCTGAGLASISARTRPEHRGITSSTFFAVLYTMLALPTVAVGLVETATNLTVAGVGFSAAVAMLSCAVLVSLRPARNSAGS